MADATLGEASLRVSLDNSGLISGLRSTEGQVRATLGGVESQVQRSSNSIRGHLSRAFSGLGQINLGALLGSTGAITALVQLEREAFQVETGMRLLDRQLERNNISFSEGRRVVNELGEELRVMPETLADNVAQLLRTGLSMDEISAAFRGGAASALAFGKDVETGIDTVASAIITGRSQLLDTIGISQNLDNAYKEYAATLGKTTAELNTLERAQAAVRLVTQYTKEEVEDMPILLSGFGGATNDLTREFKELRVALGQELMPTMTTVIQGLADLVGWVGDLPEPIKQFGVYAGAAAVGVTALATAVTTLKIAFAGFSGPAGLILGITGLIGGLVGVLAKRGGASANAEAAFQDMQRSAETAFEAMDRANTLPEIREAAVRLRDEVGGQSQLAAWDGLIGKIDDTKISAQDALAALRELSEEAILGPIAAQMAIKEAELATLSQHGAIAVQQQEPMRLVDDLNDRIARFGGQTSGLVAEWVEGLGVVLTYQGRIQSSFETLAANAEEFDLMGLNEDELRSIWGMAESFTQTVNQGIGENASRVAELREEISLLNQQLEEGRRIIAEGRPRSDSDGDTGGAAGAGDDVAQEAERTVQTVFDEVSRYGTIALRRAIAEGTTEGMLDMWKTRVGIFDRAIDELLTDFNLDPMSGEIQYLIGLLEEAAEAAEQVQEALDRGPSPMPWHSTAREIQSAQEALARVQYSNLEATRQGAIAARQREAEERRLAALRPSNEQMQASLEALARIQNSMNDATERGIGVEERLAEIRARRPAIRAAEERDARARAEQEEVEALQARLAEERRVRERHAEQVANTLRNALESGDRESLEAAMDRLTTFRVRFGDQWAEQFDDLLDQIEARIARLERQAEGAVRARIRGMDSVEGGGPSAGMASGMTPEELAAQLSETRTQRAIEASRDYVAASEARARVQNHMNDATRRGAEATETYEESIGRLQRRLITLAARGLEPTAYLVERTTREIRELQLAAALQELASAGVAGLSAFNESILRTHGILPEVSQEFKDIEEAQKEFTKAMNEADGVLGTQPTKIESLITTFEGLREVLGEDAELAAEIDEILAQLREAQAAEKQKEQFGDWQDTLETVGDALTKLVNTDWSNPNEAIANVTSAAGDLLSLIPGIGPVLGKAISTVGQILSSVLGDLSNGIAELREEVEDIQSDFSIIDVSSLIQTRQESRGGLLGLLGFTKTVLDEEATELGLSIARGIEQGVISGLRTGLDRFIETGNIEDLEFAIQEGIYGGVTDALLGAIVQGGIIQGVLGPKLLELTEAIAAGYESGDYSAALSIMSEIQGLVPELAAQLAPIFSMIGDLRPTDPNETTDRGLGGGGRQISELTGPTRDLLTDLLTPLASLVSVPSLLQEQVRIQEGILSEVTYLARGTEPGFGRDNQPRWLSNLNLPSIGAQAAQAGESIVIENLNMTTDARSARELYRDISAYHTVTARGRRR